METEWLKDDLGNIFLMNVKYVNSQNTVKSQLTADFYIKKLEQ